VHWDSELSNELWIGRRGSANGQLVKDPSTLAPATTNVVSYPGGHVEGFPDTFKQNFKAIYADIKTGGSVDHDYADFAAGVREMKVCDTILLSAKERRWVTVK